MGRAEIRLNWLATSVVLVFLCAHSSAKKIAIVAAGGRLGSAATRLALEHGHEVIAYVRNERKFRAVLSGEGDGSAAGDPSEETDEDTLEDAPHHKVPVGVTIVEGDATDEVRLRTMLKAHAADAALECLGDEQRPAAIRALISAVARVGVPLVAVAASPVLRLRTGEAGNNISDGDDLSKLAWSTMDQSDGFTKVFAELHLGTLRELRAAGTLPFWCLVCPGRMVPSATGKAQPGAFALRAEIFSESGAGGGVPLTYEDVASAMLQIALSWEKSSFNTKRVGFLPLPGRSDL
eukprot:TRINITY_DN38114_c0_g1_i1.p2 TRINITY_DN38114_c0_g1~~TRINITY_DN38114_c0_g1_i1.p2  ORF type:complete len:293 (-),score=58.31 TRINITY_DN38114_c0_g1_i1:178-1056(-)